MPNNSIPAAADLKREVPPFGQQPHERYRNLILRNLPVDVVDRLKLRAIDLPASTLMERVEHGVQYIYFIESGVGSMTYRFSDGSEVEVSMFGNESVIGISAFMGVRRSLNGVYMQMAGKGYASKTSDARAEFERGGEFQRLALRYVQMQLTQATQSAACNAKHDLGQRLARWLLLACDRAGTTELRFSQDFLAIMLGVQRSSVALVMGQLKRAGHVHYARGHISLRDPKALEARACECYKVLKDHLDNYLDFDPGFML